MNISRKIIASAGAAVLVLGLAACGDDDDAASTTTAPPSSTTVEETTTTSAEPAPAELEVADVWARTSPMMATNGAAYMVITSPVDDRLVSAAVDPSIAMTTEVHETAMSDDGSGEMQMRQVEGIDLPAGEAVELAPGGYHVMIMGLVAPLEVGSELEITLELEVAGTVTVTAEVRDA